MGIDHPQKIVVLASQFDVIDLRSTDEHPSGRTRQIRRRDSGVFHRVPSDLEQHALLRIHPRRFPRRDAEKLWIELIQIVDQARPFGHHFAHRVIVGIVQAIDRKTIVGDDVGRVIAAANQIPIGVQIGCVGESARHTDDRDRLVANFRIGYRVAERRAGGCGMPHGGSVAAIAVGPRPGQPSAQQFALGGRQIGQTVFESAHNLTSPLWGRTDGEIGWLFAENKSMVLNRQSVGGPHCD